LKGGVEGMRVRHTSDGRCYLHVYREGAEYERQKGILFAREWTTIRYALLPYSRKEGIHIYDIRRPLPFPDATFDAVYANHVLEHLTPEEGKNFASEVYRVLKPGSICRMVVPDLERMCMEYLKSLNDGILELSEPNLQKYRWSQLELIDQMVRDKSGGYQLEFLKSGRFDIEYAKYRSGDVFREFFPPARGKLSLMQKILSRTPKELFYELLRRVKLLTFGGDPRKTREANKWMYDRLSLNLLLESAGFGNFSVMDFGESNIENWDKYDFDKSNYGNYPFEPSRYVECRKPSKI
jgi:predicted SAM-dependent methyltransferase